MSYLSESVFKISWFTAKNNNLLYLIVGKLNNIDNNIKKETSMTQTAYLYCIGYILLDKFA